MWPALENSVVTALASLIIVKMCHIYRVLSGVDDKGWADMYGGAYIRGHALQRATTVLRQMGQSSMATVFKCAHTAAQVCAPTSQWCSGADRQILLQEKDLDTERGDWQRQTHSFNA